MNEQPQKFVYAHKEDGLGWDCKQCELNNGWCAEHPFSKQVKTQVLSDIDEEMESSMRIAEHEIEIEEAQNQLEKPLASEEIKTLLQNKDLI